MPKSLETLDNPACKKVWYISRSDAKTGADKAGAGLKPYKCPLCNGWHLTTTRSTVNKQRQKKLRKRGVGWVKHRRDDR